jgi:putative DNA-invertase from lambdoid prophage Rac
MRVAIYARVSTTDQSCEMQLSALRSYVAARSGWSATEYVDTGFSGARVSRPAFDRLMTAARDGALDVVLVWRLDRWGRSVANSLATIDELTKLGVRWIATEQHLDSDQSNPTARFMLTILAAVAELERSIIQERVKAGIEHARRKGKRLGRKRVVFDRATALQLQERGFTHRSIARQLGIGKGTVQRLLSTANGRTK